MEGKETGDIAQVAPGARQPYRRHLIGLPLQRSLFREAAQAATTIGLPGLTFEANFPAQLDNNGDLFLDRPQVRALSEALVSWFTPETLEVMFKTHAEACAALVSASENAAHQIGLSNGPANELFQELANKTSLVLAYGVLSKFVPDVLLRSLANAGDTEPPPFPEKSAGAELLQNMLALSEACSDLGYTPERLDREWPDVPEEVSSLVTEFSKSHTGFGPLAWDSPGHEDPRYVVRLLHSAFEGVDANQIRQRVSFAERPAPARAMRDVATTIGALRRVLGLWLEFLERETWYVRRAFYVGMVPLLTQLAAGFREKVSGLKATDLLFLDLRELNAGIVDPALIRSRRDRYLENTEYLSLHGVDPNRFATTFVREHQ